jgi:pyruvate dehydrogenase E2 component (dihydrolipoamide acetyltransferase)
MITKVHMEALSPTMEEGQLVRWLKSEGDEVSDGEVLAEIETDKATMELVARGDGILRKIFLGEGGTAPVGDVIAVVADAEEDISGVEGAGDGGGAAAPPAAEETTETDEIDEAGAEEAEGPLEGAGSEAPSPGAGGAPAGGYGARQESAEAGGTATAATPSDNGRIKASPLARRLAEDMGVDLARIQGSGPGGRVVKRDVEEAGAAGVGAPAPEGPSWIPEGPDFEDVPVSQMRKTIAKRLVQSIGPVPHFFLTVDVDMGRMLEARVRLNALLEPEGRKVSINDLVLKAVAGALRKHPECNAWWQDGTIRRFHTVHLGVAVAVDDGLITPVVRHAERKGVADIATEVRELAGRAREKRLKPDEYTGATFSVSNLGMFGIREFTAIINPPEAGILAVGGIEEVPVVEGGEVVVRSRMTITMSCDHRVIDGAQGSRFLQTLKAMLEEPAAILL